MLLSFKHFARIYYAMALLTIIIVSGTLGFMIVEGWGLIESFYMTIITISTVGFQEVHELSDAGRLFTAFLIITSFGTFAYAVSAITSYVVGGEYKKYFKEYKILKKVEGLKDHTIICGFGRVGSQAAMDLEAYGVEYIILEKSREVIERKGEGKEIPFMEADATSDEQLALAGLHKARALITALPKDADNLYVVLAAREMNPNMKIIARATSSSAVSKLRIAGASNVIMPDRVGGAHMASLVVTPDAMEFIDLIKVTGRNETNLEEISFSNLPEEYKYKTLDEVDSKRITGVTIIGYRSPDGEYVINPDPATKITPNSKLFVLGNPTQIEQLNRHLGIKPKG